MFDVQKARFFQEQKELERRGSNYERLRVARQDFGRIVAMLVEKYHPVKIYQWGSLLSEEDFCEISDVDIAVEGEFSAELFFDMLGDAEAMTSFPLDLVDMSKIEPEFAEIIRMKGRVVYERGVTCEAQDSAE